MYLILDEADAFEKQWDQQVHSYNHAGMVLGGRHHRRPLNQRALSSKPYHSQDYDEEATGVPHQEKRKEKHRYHQEHFDNEAERYVNQDYAARTRPHHSLTTDADIQYPHASTELDPDFHQQYHGKPKGLRASKRNNTEMDAGHHHGSRPRAPGVGHRSKPQKNVKFPDDDTDGRFVRKESHHYAKHARDNSCHSTKKSTSNQFY